MRIPRLAVIAASLLLSPLSSAADTLVFRVTGGELAVTFGLVPFQLSEDVESDDFDVTGTANLVSGALVNHNVDEENGITGYDWGPGTLTLTLSGFDEDGNFVDGTFTASTRKFGFDVCEGCDDLFGGGLVDDFEIDLGAGLFDAPLAKLLGVSRHTIGGFIDFGLEDVSGDGNSESRSAFDHRGFAVLEIETAIPEPGLLTLGLIAGAAWLARRKGSPYFRAAR
jgi:hypothetical protein